MLGDFVAALGTETTSTSSPAPIRLAPDEPASFLVVRGGEPTGLDARKLDVDTVYIDGRELPPPDRSSSK
jgi:hypothetical protein